MTYRTVKKAILEDRIRDHERLREHCIEQAEFHLQEINRWRSELANLLFGPEDQDAS